MNLLYKENFNVTIRIQCDKYWGYICRRKHSINIDVFDDFLNDISTEYYVIDGISNTPNIDVYTKRNSSVSLVYNLDFITSVIPSIVFNTNFKPHVEVNKIIKKDNIGMLKIITYNNYSVNGTRDYNEFFPSNYHIYTDVAGYLCISICHDDVINILDNLYKSDLISVDMYMFSNETNMISHSFEINTENLCNIIEFSYEQSSNIF